MDVARFGVVIDPTQTRAGAAEIKADIKSIGAEAKAMNQAIVAAVENAAREQVKAFQEITAAATNAARQEAAEARAAAAATTAAAKEKAAAEKQAAADMKAAAKQTAAEQKAAAEEAAAVVKAQAAEKEAAEKRAAAAAKAAAREAAAVAASSAAERQRAEQRAAAAARESAAASRGAMRGLFSEVANGLQIVAGFIPGVSGLFLTLAGTAGGAAVGIGSMAASSGLLVAAIVPLLAVLGLLTAALVALGASIIFGDRMNAAVGKINSATKDLQAARAVYDALYQTSLRTGASIDDSAGSFVRFSVAARGIGASHAQVLQLVETIQKAGIVGGSTASELSAATMQLGQALASGKFQGDELRSVLENMPTFAEKLAKELNTDVAGLRKMGEEGKLNAQNIFPAMLRTTEAIRKEFEAMPMTMGRGFAALQLAVGRLFADLDQATGFSKAFGKGMADAALEADRLRKILVGGIAAGNLGEIIGTNLKIAGMEFVNTVEKGLLGMAALFATALAGAAGAAIAPVLILIKPEFWSAAGNLGKAAFLTVVDTIKAILKTITTAFENAVIAIRNRIPERFGGTRGNPVSPIVAGSGGVNPDIIAARNAAASDVRALMSATTAQFQEGAAAITTAINNAMLGVNMAFPEEQIERLKTTRDELAKVALKMAEVNATLDKTTKVVVDPTKWQGTGTAPKLDTEIIKDLQERIRFFQANADKGIISQNAAARGIEQARQGATTELGDPRAAAVRYPEAIEQWRAFHEARKRIAEDADRRIEAGHAAMLESFSRGLQQAADSWGNAQQQMARVANGLANSISSNLTGALTAFATGAKDAKTAFRDMAVAILNDIAKMLIQMSVELLLQYLINAARGGFAGGGFVAGSGGSTFGAASRASAGGGSGGSSPVISAGGGATIAPTISRGGGASIEPTLPAGGFDVGDNPGAGIPLFRSDIGGLRYGRGGRIAGGGGGIDDVPAWLTSGEYVIKKEAVDTYGTAMLDAINERRAKRFAEGGRVATAPVRGATGGDTYAFDIKVDAGGGTTSSSGTGSQGDEARKRKELAEMIKNQVHNVIVEQKRPGGLLNAR